MRIFGSDRISGLMLKLGMEEGVPIEHGMVTKSIERAQKQVEAQNFAIRKHLLEYDDVMNKQRTAVYDMRRMILEGKDTEKYVVNLSLEVLDWFLDNYAPEKDDPDSWNLDGLQSALKDTYGFDVPLSQLKAMGRTEMVETFGERIRKLYEDKQAQVGPEAMNLFVRMVMLQIVDTQWKDHLYALDHLKEGIGLRGYGQRDPLVEYKKESFNMFQALMDRIDEEMLRWIYLAQPMRGGERPEDQEPPAPRPVARPRLPRDGGLPPARVPEPPAVELGGGLGIGTGRGLPRNLTFNNPTETPSAFDRAEPREAQGGTDEVQTVRREGKKVGRNEPCPCGSGKKYKKCHGAN
jgi:preprotein translocase subunit SecA